MELHQVYIKTARGLEEVQSRTYKLSAHLRRLLIMVDGRSTAAELIGRLTTLGNIELELAELEAGGFIARPGSGSSAPGAASPATSPEFNLDEAKQSIRSVQPGFNLAKAKGVIRFTLLGALGPTAARRIERIDATTTPEELRLELDAIRDMLPKALSRRQAEQAWRQLEPIMISITAAPP